MTNTFIAAVANRRAAAGDWGGWVRAQLTEHGFTLTGDGELWFGDELVGRGELIERRAEDRLLPGEVRAVLDAPAPYTGPVVGYVGWTHAVAPELAERHLVPAMCVLSQSSIVRPDTGQHKRVVRPVAFSLANLVGNHGFADGEALLGRDDAYLRDVQRAAGAALTAAGLSGDVGRFDSHHNPIRLVGELRASGRVVDDPEAELARHAVTIWAYDLAARRDPEFWID
jgi:hypothetical protein